jgi:hypothetical protein
MLVCPSYFLLIILMELFMSLLSSLGLNPSLLSALGVGGEQAAGLFGKESVSDYLEDVFNFQLDATGSTNGEVNLGSLFDNLVQTTEASVFQQNGLLSPAEYQNQVNQILMDSTGNTLNDLNYAIDDSGNITAGIDGVSSTTLNINDLFNQALSQVDM